MPLNRTFPTRSPWNWLVRRSRPALLLVLFTTSGCDQRAIATATAVPAPPALMPVPSVAPTVSMQAAMRAAMAAQNDDPAAAATSRTTPSPSLPSPASQGSTWTGEHLAPGIAGGQVSGTALRPLHVPLTLTDFKRLAARPSGKPQLIPLAQLPPEFSPFVEICNGTVTLAIEAAGHGLNEVAHETRAALPVALLVAAGEILLKDRDHRTVCRYRPK